MSCIWRDEDFIVLEQLFLIFVIDEDGIKTIIVWNIKIYDKKFLYINIFCLNSSLMNRYVMYWKQLGM